MKKKKKEEADLDGSASRHVFRVYNELSGFWKNLEREEEKIFRNRGVCGWILRGDVTFP